MDEPRNPNLYVAADNSPEAIRKRRALDDLHWPAREFVANLLRVMRGAGRPLELPDQLIQFALAAKDADEAGNNVFYIGSEIEDVVQQALPQWQWTDPDSAYRTISKGALQLLASHLMSQRAQEARGEKEIDGGIKELERKWERMREKWRQQDEELIASVKPIIVKTKKRKATTAARKSSKPEKQASSSQGQPPAPAADVQTEQRPSSTAEFMKRRRDELLGD